MRFQFQYGVILAIAIVVGVGVYLVINTRQHNAQAESLPNDVDMVSGSFATVYVWHDRVRHVTCWQTPGTGSGVSCIPDWQLTPPDGGAR